MEDDGFNSEIFASRLKEAMNAQDVKQNVLAKTINVDPSTISHYLAGRRLPEDLYLFCRILEALRVPADYMLGRNDYKNARLVTKKEIESILPGTNFNLKIFVEGEEKVLTDSTKNAIRKILEKDGAAE